MLHVFADMGAVDKLHRKKFFPVDLDEIEDPTDIRRDDFTCRADFAAERLDSAGVAPGGVKSL